MSESLSQPAIFVRDVSDGLNRYPGQANGLATLDSMATIPLSQIPSSVIDGLTPQTAWNAATNTPNLVTATPSVGDFWWVSVAGATSLGGITPWTVGQWAVYGASGWAQMTPGGVLSFNSRSGYVVPVAGDYDGLPLNLAAASSFVAPVAASASPTVAGSLAFDSTANHLQIGDGSASLTVLDETSIGVDVQAYAANLDAWSDLVPGTMATQNANNVSISGGSITGITDLAVADGGTGGSTPAAARAALGAQRSLAPTAAVKTSLYTAVAGEIVCYDASGGTFQINAPATPSDGDVFAVWETAGSTTAITVSGNGANINRAASVSLSAADAFVVFQYSSARSRWLVGY